VVVGDLLRGPVRPLVDLEAGQRVEMGGAVAGGDLPSLALLPEAFPDRRGHLPDVPGRAAGWCLPLRRGEGAEHVGAPLVLGRGQAQGHRAVKGGLPRVHWSSFGLVPLPGLAGPAPAGRPKSSANMPITRGTSRRQRSPPGSLASCWLTRPPTIAV